MRLIGAEVNEAGRLVLGQSVKIALDDGPFSQNPIDSFFNTEISHEQLFFEDGKQPSEIGYDPDGTFSGEDPSEYYRGDGGYDDALMRQAVDDVNSSRKWKGSKYSLIGRNCQSWADAVRKRYRELEKGKKKMCNNLHPSMVLVYTLILVVSGIVSAVLRSFGVKHAWLIGSILFFTLSIGFTAWLDWQIRHSAYP